MINGKQAINEAIRDLNKKYGAGTVVQAKAVEDLVVESISTGIPALDAVLGCGGLPKGRIIELFGEESSGKSTLALYLVSQIQKKDGKVLWIDVEKVFDAGYAAQMGVQTDKIFVTSPATGEEALDIVNKMALTGGIDLIILDSIAALVPQKELEGEIIDADMALTARMMSKALRMIAGNISDSKTIFICINQTREKIGIFWGKKTTTPGGKALKFFSSVRLEVKKGKAIMSGSEMVGNKITICAVKNKVGIPFRTCELDLFFGKQIK